MIEGGTGKDCPIQTSQPFEPCLSSTPSPQLFCIIGRVKVTINYKPIRLNIKHHDIMDIDIYHTVGPLPWLIHTWVIKNADKPLNKKLPQMEWIQNIF